MSDMSMPCTRHENVSMNQGFLDISHTSDRWHCAALLAYFVAVVVIAWWGGG